MTAVYSLFAVMYEVDTKSGRTWKSLHAILPTILYSFCSERMLMKQIQYSMHFRWFV